MPIAEDDYNDMATKEAAMYHYTPAKNDIGKKEDDDSEEEENIFGARRLKLDDV